MLIPVILAGGSGTRLWPLSRQFHPKQLMPLVGQDTMIQATLKRLEDAPDAGGPIIICNEIHRFMIAEQLRNLGWPARIVLEPVGRNTAPAVAVAALMARDQDTDPVLLIMPSDHYIAHVPSFLAAVNTGRFFAEQGALVTFGIMPDGPETGYGYIRKGAPADLFLRIW